MTITTTTRLALYQWSSGADSPQRVQFDASFLSLEQNAAMYKQGLFSARPSAGVEGRFYAATDTGLIYYDTGTVWLAVNSLADITAVIAGTGLTGGATSGDATLSIDTSVVATLAGTQTFTGVKTFTAPILGTPTSATLTNATGLPISTGVSGLATGIATFLATPTSANLASAVTDETGTGSLVFATSPTLVTPNLGTPSTAVLTNATGLPIASGVSGLATGIATFLATPTSANLIAAVTDETGTGALVFANSPVLVTPNLGTPSAAVLTSATGLPISTGVSGLATGIATFLATPTSANLIAAVTDETGTGALVFANSPTLVTPALGTPASGIMTNVTGLPIATGVSGLGAGIASFLGTPSSANLATAITDETGTGSLVFANSPTLVSPFIHGSVATQSGTTYTVVANDDSTFIKFTNAGAVTVTIPTNATTAFVIGTEIDIVQDGAGQITVVAATPGTTTIKSTGGTTAQPKTRRQYSELTIKKTATDEWYVNGDIV